MKKLTKKQQTVLNTSVSNAIGRMVVMNECSSNMVKEPVIETSIDMDKVVARFVLMNTLFEAKKVVVSKANQARIIFDEMYQKSIETGVNMVRKEVIARFMAECGLTKNGASTYVQNIKNERGLVVHN